MSKKKKRADRFFSKKEKKQVSDAIWQAQNDLHATDFIIDYTQTKKDVMTGENGDYIEGAKILVNPKYLTAHITFPPNSRKSFREDKEAFRRVVYHEVTHVIIDPMYLDQFGQLSPIEKEYWNGLREQAVEKVGRVGRWKREIHDDFEALKKKSEGGDR